MPDQLAVQVTLRDYNVEMRALAHRGEDGIWRIDKIERKRHGYGNGTWESSQSQIWGNSFVPTLNREVTRANRDPYWRSWEAVVGHHVRAYLDKVGEL